MYMEHNGQECLYVVPPGKIVFDEVQNDLRRFTSLRLRQLKYCTIWMRLSLLLELLSSNRVFDVVDLKNIRFQSSTRIPQTVGLKKVHFEERFRCADSLVSCGRKADTYFKKYAVSKVYGA